MCNQTEQFLLRGLFGKRVLLAVKAALLAGALLIADVNLARRIVADDNNRQTRRYALFFQRLGVLAVCSAQITVTVGKGRAVVRTSAEKHLFLFGIQRGKKGGDTSGSESGSTLNIYINNNESNDPYNHKEDNVTQVE